MEKSKLELDRCILFPRSQKASVAIENRELDSRYETEVIDISYSDLSKLNIFGFFDYPKDIGISIVKNSFIQLPAVHIPLAIDAALKSRKETIDKDLLNLIDRFVQKAKNSSRQGLPIWFNT